MFDIGLLQAISDWQIGGNAAMKKKRAEKLVEACAGLDNKYKAFNGICYRKLKLDSTSVFSIGTEYKLSEAISAWTIDPKVAMDFKDGVPPKGYQGAIFKLKDSDKYDVVVNLDSLWNDPAFEKFYEENKSQIKDHKKGIGKYKNTQKEVIINVDILPLDSIYAWGGYTSSEEEIIAKYCKLFNISPKKKTLASIKLLFNSVGGCGPEWLTNEDGIARVSAKLIEFGKIAKIIKSMQEQSKLI